MNLVEKDLRFRKIARRKKKIKLICIYVYLYIFCIYENELLKSWNEKVTWLNNQVISRLLTKYGSDLLKLSVK